MSEYDEHTQARLSIAEIIAGWPDILERNKKEWWAWHKRNPEIQDEFNKICLALIKGGQRHYSASAVANVLRYHRHCAGDDGFDINNNHIPSMARLFMVSHIEHLTFFRLRKSPGTIPEGAHEVTEKAGDDQ